MVSENPDAPHSIILGIEAQLMEQLPTGEYTGNPIVTKHYLDARHYSDLASAMAAIEGSLKELFINGK
jgi:hypothetical protein